MIPTMEADVAVVEEVTEETPPIMRVVPMFPCGTCEKLFPAKQLKRHRGPCAVKAQKK